jgi:ribosomal-protein-alanine N-acetyltransferase
MSGTDALQALFVEAGRPEDAPALARLEAACMTHPWGKAQLLVELSREGPPAVVLLRDALRREEKTGGLLGFSALRATAGEAEILNLGIAPEARGRGLGRFLLRLARRLAARRGAGELFLEVRESNLAARRLYASEGFLETARRRRYYSQPVEDAVLMRAATGQPGSLK